MALQLGNALRALLVIVIAPVALSCGDEEGGDDTFEPPPVFGAIDPSMTCEPGYVGWNFATGGGIEALPKPMKITSLDCDGMGEPKTPSALGQGVKTQCPGATSCNFVENCKTLVVKWTCGDATTALSREFPGGRGSLSCYVRGSQEEGASDLDTLAGKACVPKTCPNNTFRDEKLRCVTATKVKPRQFAFGPPAAISLQRTSANESKELLVADTEYFFFSTLTLGVTWSDWGNPHLPLVVPEGRLEYWIADEYVAKDASSGLAPVQGFRCTAAQTWVSASTVFDGVIWNHAYNYSVPPAYQKWVVARTIASPQCTADAAAVAAQRDAARRATMSLADFQAKYTLKQLRLHTSFDMEGRNILPEDVEKYAVPESAKGCLPRPPGFFYRVAADPKDSYIDMIEYYRQRELTAYLVYDPGRLGITDNPRANFSGFWSSNPPVYNRGLADGSGRTFGTRSSELPTRIRISAKNMLLNTPELEIAKFGDVQPRINLSLEHRIAGGDNRSNPYGFDGPSVGGVSNLKDRKLRADVYIHPATSAAFDASTAVRIGSVPLGDALATGTMTNGVVSIGKRNRRRFFEDWKGIDNFKVFYCIGAEGLETLTGQLNLNLPAVTNNGIDYSAGVDPDSGYDGVLVRYRCSAADTVMVVHRDESRRPLNPAAASPNQESESDSQSGDANSEGSQGTQGEKMCSGSRCTTVQHADMGILGNFGSTIFDSSSSTTEEENGDGSGEVEMDADAELLGFTILDMPEDGTGEWADDISGPHNTAAFSLSPEWGAIEEALDKALTGTSAEAEEGRYGGRDGLGIGFGYKTFLTGPVPGVINVGVSAGVGLSVDLEVTNKPENDYPCAASAGSKKKCYLVLEDATTQEDARAECAKLGGYLAEARTEDDLDDIQQVLADESGRLWLGGQQAYQYVGGSCAETADATCAAAAKLNYRWLSDDLSFATATGSGGLIVSTSSPLTSADVNLVSQLPTETAVAYDTGSDRLVLRATNELLTGVCQFDPATRATYLKIQGGLTLGVAAGVGVSFCTPTEDFGVCIEGSISFVGLELQFVAFNELHTITRSADAKKNKVGGSGTDVPWKLKLLAGELVAKFNFYLFSVSQKIVSWDGFTAAQGSLFDTYTAVVEKAP